jgi:hypothetical protein
MAVRFHLSDEVTAATADRIDVQDRVSVPDGRNGSVIGFFMRDPMTVLVAFEPGDVREFSPADLQRL